MKIRTKAGGDAWYEVAATVTTGDDEGNEVRTYWVRPAGVPSQASVALTPVKAEDVVGVED